jgi:hypothetical protein
MHRVGFTNHRSPASGDHTTQGFPEPPEPSRPSNARLSDRELTILCVMSENPAASDRELSTLLSLPASTIAAARARTRRLGLWRPRFELHPALAGSVPRAVAWGIAAKGATSADLNQVPHTLARLSASGVFAFRGGMYFALLLPGDFNRLASLQAALMELRAEGTREFLLNTYDSVEFAAGPDVQRAYHRPTALLAKLLLRPACPPRTLIPSPRPDEPGLAFTDLGVKQTHVLIELLAHAEKSHSEIGGAYGYSTNAVAHIKSRLVRERVLRHSFHANLPLLGYPYSLFIARAHRPLPLQDNWRLLRDVGGLTSAPVTFAYSRTASAAYFPFRTLEAAREGATVYRAQCEGLQMRSDPHGYVTAAAQTRRVGYCAPRDLVSQSFKQFFTEDSAVDGAL